MPTKSIKSICFFHRPHHARAIRWVQKIERSILKKHPRIKITDRKPNVVIVLGGDGTILEAARRYAKTKSIILGLNLGQVGFLASVREPNKFIPAVKTFLNGRYELVERMMLTAEVIRKRKIVRAVTALNDITVQNPLGIVELRVVIENHPMQYIRGTGVLVSTSTGSTGYNLSAHGPIVMPDIRCFIITELLDHNLPTPSIVVKHNKDVFIKIVDFRKRGLLALPQTNELIDVILTADGESIFPLEKYDTVVVKRSPASICFAELEKGYFFKSLQEKFAFK
ncbi:NAD(+)/NADH kinase [Candidatus Jorgensenbacteria bacterium]|nr:NAD(+)/NADH kinase [Candidatus Jorgensenbacteria bacterium]